MSRKEVVQFLQNNSIAYITSSSDDIPSVRVMQILSIDEKEIAFNTKHFKQLYKDLCKNKNVEDYPQLKPLIEKEGIETIKPFKIENWKYKKTDRH